MLDHFMQSLQVVRSRRVACMWVRWINTDGLNYPRTWEGTMASMLELIEE